MIIALCLALCGCADSEKKPSSEITSGDVETALTPETEAETTEETKVEETTSAPETQPTEEPWQTVDGKTAVITDGGAVVVGRLTRNSGGWSFALDEPLYVELTLSDGSVCSYREVTKMKMYEVGTDGIEKGVYLGTTVTVSGRLSVENDIIYVTPYEITMGKNVARSYGDPSVTKPEPAESKLDLTVPLPEKTNATFVDGVYKYNPYRLSDETLEKLGNGFADFYIEFVDSYLAYKSSCPCDNELYAKYLSSVLFYECPVFEANGIYDYSVDYDKENGKINIRYGSDYDSHQKLISDFFKAADKLVSNALEGMTEAQRAKAVYHALATSVQYDYVALEKLDKNNPYYAYTIGRGVCITFSMTFVQLLEQVGIDATIVSGQMVNGEAHVWSYATIDGKNYFFDPTFESSRDKGVGYVYFGMSLGERTKDGTGFRGMSIGRYDVMTVEEADVSAESIEK